MMCLSSFSLNFLYLFCFNYFLIRHVINLTYAEAKILSLGIFAVFLAGPDLFACA